MSNEEFKCRMCGKEITKEQYDNNEGLCEFCWDEEQDSDLIEML